LRELGIPTIDNISRMGCTFRSLPLAQRRVGDCPKETYTAIGFGWPHRVAARSAGVADSTSTIGLADTTETWVTGVSATEYGGDGTAATRIYDVAARRVRGVWMLVRRTLLNYVE
jgi:hypothetical protein